MPCVQCACGTACYSCMFGAAKILDRPYTKSHCIQLFRTHGFSSHCQMKPVVCQTACSEHVMTARIGNTHVPTCPAKSKPPSRHQSWHPPLLFSKVQLMITCVVMSSHQTRLMFGLCVRLHEYESAKEPLQDRRAQGWPKVYTFASIPI